MRLLWLAVPVHPAREGRWQGQEAEDVSAPWYVLMPLALRAMNSYAWPWACLGKAMRAPQLAEQFASHAIAIASHSTSGLTRVQLQ